jgi:ADP-heptose:LPS heptosyltransferase
LTAMRSSLLPDVFFNLTSSFTRWFPRQGGKILDGLFYPALGNQWLVDSLRKANHRKLARLTSFKRLLVISDIHIGDAVLIQRAVSALRDFFPDAQIDYMVKKSTACLLEGHPDVSELWPVFTGSRFPNESDIQNVQEMSVEYDAVFNFCPFLKPDWFPEKQKTFHALTHAADFARNEWKEWGVNHISFQAHRFIYEIFHPFFSISRARPFDGPGLFLSPGAIGEARAVIEGRMGWKRGPVVFLNPETASPFTQIPLASQSNLLNKLVEMPCHILLGEGRADRDLAERLRFSVPAWKRDRIALIPPDLPLDSYAALLDWSDIFISGDTGPLHLAAAWKKDRSGRHFFRNRTSVMGVFGATPPRLSGYDSRLPGYLESEQRAWAYSYQSQSACRNITCMHKMAKVCDAKGCFQALDLDKILFDIKDLIGTASLSS